MIEPKDHVRKTTATFISGAKHSIIINDGYAALYENLPDHGGLKFVYTFSQKDQLLIMAEALRQAAEII